MGAISSEPYHQNRHEFGHHVVLFPFMAKGHTLPILHLARLLLCRNLSVTVFTTPANRHWIAESLHDTAAAIAVLPFPNDIYDNIPAGVESTDKLPSISLLSKFAMSTQHMKPHFDSALESLPRVAFIISDLFLWWTLDSASRLGIPRFVFSGMNNYSGALYTEAFQARIFHGVHSDDELVMIPRFPWIRVTRNDFDPAFTNPDTQSSVVEFYANTFMAADRSYGSIVNSFYELEPEFVDYYDKEIPVKIWCVGPLCTVDIKPSPNSAHDKVKPYWIEWLDQRLEEGSPVMYVSFGSQFEISEAQVKEMAIGLEESKVNFLWVIRNGLKVGYGFEERVRGRGLVVREWVDQREILMHEGVQGFLSHCGWNSVLESVCAGVPILAWPLGAEQPLNARMVDEELKVGMRVETCDGSVRGFVKWEGLKKKVREFMMEGEEVRRNMEEVSAKAWKAVEEGGSSWRTMNMLIDETCTRK